MSVFKDEMYKYITSEKNFELAAELHEMFPEVKERLVKEFWDIVAGKIEELAKDDEWVVGVEGDSIHVYKEDYWNCYVEVNILRGQTIYGINIKDDETLDMEKARDLLQKNSALEGFVRSRDWLMHKRKAWIDFSINLGLKRLLPEVRDSFAQSIAQEVYDFAENTVEDLKKIEKANRKK